MLTQQVFCDTGYFWLIMGLIFWLTFGVIGSLLERPCWRVASILHGYSDITETALTAGGFNPVMISLVVDGIFAGVGSVLSFIPTIVVLFFFLSLLEDSGYMARVAFRYGQAVAQDRSFGAQLCADADRLWVQCARALWRRRTLPSDRDRKMTMLLTPFMSCSAKLPIYGMFTMAFFPDHRALVMIGLYVLGMLLAIISGLVLNKTVYRGNPVPFIMELPNYRMPSGKTVLRLLWDKAKDFITRAFTVIFIATLIIWFFQTFDWRFNVVADSSDSMLAGIGRLIAPAFVPLGFNDWRASTALITGFMAKEAVISTFAVLTGATAAGLPAALSQMFTPLAALAFLVFTLIYSPCVAAIATVKREMQSAWAALGVVLYQTGVAWVVAFAVFQIGRLLT